MKLFRFQVASHLRLKKLFWKPPVIQKIVLKAGFDMYTRKGGTEILMRLSEQSLELLAVFKKARRDLTIIFIFHSLKI